jgi:hypothetical protein
VNAIG